jgi:hypothetical protein
MAKGFAITPESGQTTAISCHGVGGRVIVAVDF